MFGLIFGAVSALSQIAAYSIGIRPTINYAPAPRVRITGLQLLFVVNRTVGYGFLAWLCVCLVHQPDYALDFGIRIGLTMGVVTFVLSSLTPIVEWGADRVPERRMGVFGIVLMVVGFLLQSLQYWIALLDIPLH